MTERYRARAAMPITALRARVENDETIELNDGWQACATAPGAQLDGGDLDRLRWNAASVPGTAADVLRDRGEPPARIAQAQLDDEDWWFRTEFRALRIADGEEATLELDGLATLSEVYLNGELVLESDSMFERHSVSVGGRLRPHNELAICARALTPRLRVRRRPRARWRTRLVAEGNLRFVRTMLLGRVPGFAPGPAVVGPYRPVRLRAHRSLLLSSLEVRPRLHGDSGVLAVELGMRSLGAARPPERATLELRRGSQRWETELALSGDGDGGPMSARGELSIPNVERWWPHTHGDPARYGVRVRVSDGAREVVIDAGHTGFRALHAAREIEAEGLALELNGVRVFARGAIWTPFAFASALGSDTAELRATLTAMRDAGMNIVRLPGTGAYETGDFHDLCDELGILVWQDLMFANLDYPDADPDFLAGVERELRQVLGDLAGHPSLAVICGSSEVDQQVAMLGLDPALARGELFGRLLPELVAESGLDALYVPSAPSGGSRAFRPDRGVASYFGVGGYRRPLDDARRADVRFAAECLAMANVPDEDALDVITGDGGPPVIHDPRWKAGVPRDLGAGWDFDDVRDHYLRTLFELDPGELRRVDPARYLELSRELSGELLAEVLGEWRRGRSACEGAVILWLRDLQPGAGWGLLDHRGRPKVAWHHVRRALAPVAVWSTDEGLAGIAAHVANDRGERLDARLRVALYKDWELCVEEATCELAIEPHGWRELDVEELIGRFLDVSWAYRFGPPAHDVVALSLEQPGGELLSQTFRMPGGRPLWRESAERLGLTATLVEGPAGDWGVLVATRRFAYGVRVEVPGFIAADDAFSLEPGHQRTIALEPLGSGEGAQPPAGSLGALNLHGRVALRAMVIA